MGTGAQHQVTDTIKPAAAIARRRFINWDFAQAGADDDCMAIAPVNLPANVNGLAIIGGTAVIEAGAVLDGSVKQLKSNADGQAIPCTAGDAVQAVLKKGQTADAAGDPVVVYMIGHISPVT